MKNLLSIITIITFITFNITNSNASDNENCHRHVDDSVHNCERSEADVTVAAVILTTILLTIITFAVRGITSGNKFYEDDKGLSFYSTGSTDSQRLGLKYQQTDRVYFNYEQGNDDNKTTDNYIGIGYNF